MEHFEWDPFSKSFKRGMLKAPAKPRKRFNMRTQYEYEFVDPRCNETPHGSPYSYDPFYHFRNDYPENLRNAEYSDRLQERDREAFTEALRHAGKRFDQMNTKQASAFLSAYFGREMKCTALAEGCNKSNGYPYWIFWMEEV